MESTKGLIVESSFVVRVCVCINFFLLQLLYMYFFISILDWVFLSIFMIFLNSISGLLMFFCQNTHDIS